MTALIDGMMDAGVGPSIFLQQFRLSKFGHPSFSPQEELMCVFHPVHALAADDDKDGTVMFRHVNRITSSKANLAAGAVLQDHDQPFIPFSTYAQTSGFPSPNSVSSTTSCTGSISSNGTLEFQMDSNNPIFPP